MTPPPSSTVDDATWPSLELAAWADTCATLHMWTQIVGKIRLAQAPLVNHWWQVPLYVSARGLTTTAIPCGPHYFQIDFDFIDHRLIVQTSDGKSQTMTLRPQSVADFYAEIMQRLRDLGLDIRIWTMPVEIENPIAFETDRVHDSYDRQYANRFWRALVQADRVLAKFRGRFIGKCSPVHFFWGSFDLAVTRFSGRPAMPPPGPDADSITREAYSHEVCSAGFWPGNGGFDRPSFYVYAAPEPAGYAAAKVRPAATYYNKDYGQFFLHYDDVRAAQSPDDTLLDYLQSTYEAAASLAKWDRAALERGA